MGCCAVLCELRLDDPGCGLVDGFIAIEPQADGPPADVEALADGGDDVIGQRAGLVVPLLARGQHRRAAQPAADGRRLLQQAVATDAGDQVHRPAQVIDLVQLEIEPDHGFRRGHQPHACLGDHAEVGLHEHLVPGRTESVTIEIPGGRTGHRAHAGAHQLAGGQHHFHAADLAPCARHRWCSPRRDPAHCRPPSPSCCPAWTVQYGSLFFWM